MHKNLLYKIQALQNYNPRIRSPFSGILSDKIRIRPKRTRLIKDKLALLGHHKFGYKVYVNGLSPILIQKNGQTPI